MKKFNFPVIKNVKIQNFSLYRRADYLDIDLGKNVYCLAGANGLGKSTFITIINYGLTGIVKNPNRRFTWYNEIPKFYNQSKGFAATYFDGRIEEDDVDLSQVTLVFDIGDYEYTVTRGFFEPDELRFFSKTSSSSSFESPENLSFTEINDLFKSHFVKDVNLSQFDQFVFLQSYVLTFDETHQLLFWDESLMERVLYLFFGVDPSKAKNADKLRKEFNKSDSDVRNRQWEITKARNELNSIRKKMQGLTVDDTESIEIVEMYKSLTKESDELNEFIDGVREEIRDCDLNISDLSIRASSLRSEYEFIFKQSLTEDVPIEKNPLIIAILNELKIRIFSSRPFDDIIEKLVAEIKSRRSLVSNTKNSSEYFDDLKKIDEKLAAISGSISEYQNKKDRLIERENSLIASLNQIGSKIDAIEKENSDTIKGFNNLLNETPLDALIKSYEEVILQSSVLKAESQERKNNARKELEKLEKELNQGFLDAESKFIPIFNSYAKSFLGLNIEIGIATSNKGATLYLEIQDSKRRNSFQLSESQRYFIDIALRMALIELSTESATFLIDTPEGSLDIAYESRAGQMLADFARSNHKLIMTANINSSQLLLELASKCKADKMKLERMTNWTTLSDVQQQESDRIEEAYHNVETALG